MDYLANLCFGILKNIINMHQNKYSRKGGKLKLSRNVSYSTVFTTVVRVRRSISSIQNNKCCKTLHLVTLALGFEIIW